MLESEYPYQIIELIHLLLALCNGSWSAQCVYSFLHKMRGVTLLYEIPSGSPPMNVYATVEAHGRIPIPSVDGIYISPGTRGQILKVIGVNVALVHWEWAHSGVYFLVLRVAQLSNSSCHDEVFLALSLLYRLISSDVALCFNFLHLDESLFTQAARTNGLIDQNLCIDVVRVISFLVVRIIDGDGQTSTVGVCLSILAEMLKCNPSRVVDVVLSSNIFGTGVVSSSGAWLLSDGLSRMLLTDHEEESGCFLLTMSVLDFTIQLIQKGVADTLVSSLVVFSLQYVFVNDMHMKYKLKHGHWKVTLKVLAVIKSCLKAVRNSHKLSSIIRDILYFDSSIHSGLCYFLHASKQALENSSASREFGLKETEDLQDAVCSALDIVFSMLADLSKVSTSAAPSFVQTLLPASSKTASVFTVTLSLMNLFSFPAVQLAAAKVLSGLCSVASRLQPYSLESITLADALQISDLAAIVYRILDEEPHRRNDFFIAIINLLISAAYFQPSLLLPMISTNIGGFGISAGDAENNLAQAPVGSRRSVIDTVLKCMDRSELHISSDPQLLMSTLSFLKSLWDGGVQYMDILVKVRNSTMFWEHLSSILASRLNFDQPLEDMSDDVIQTLTYRYHCQAIALEIMSRELFFQEKVSQNEIIEKLALPSGSNGHYENRFSSEASQSSSKLLQSNVLTRWCQGSVIDDLMKSYSSGGYDIQLISRAKMAACVLIVHLMLKLWCNGTDCLSMPIIEMIHMIQDKLRQNPSFSSLLVQYSLQGYSDGKEVISLVLHDLYHHLQGELEGRLIIPGPFQALSGFLLNLETFQCKEGTHEKDLWNTDVIMYEVSSIRNELGIDLWDMASWKESKEIVEKCLSHMHAANLMITLANAKTFAHKALIAVISLRGKKFLKSKSTLTSEGISEAFLEQSITYVCKCIQSTEVSLVPALNPPEKLLEMLTTQAEMLFVLSGILFMQQSHRNKKKELFPVSLILIRTSGSCFKLLAAGMLSTRLNKAIKFLLMVLLMSMEFNNPTSYITDDSGLDDNQLSEVSLAIVGLLPVLCKYVENTECFDLSVASMDLMLKGFLAPNTWLPILQEHLHLKNLVQIIQKRNSLIPVKITLNFLLTLAQTKGGAEMLNSIKIFPSLKIFFSHLVDDKFKQGGDCLPTNHDSNDKHAHLLALGFAIISSVIHSLHDDTSIVHIFDSAIHSFFGEKAYMMSLCLSVLNVQSDGRAKTTSRKQETGISLKDLCLSEQSLSLICLLTRHREYRRKGVKEINLELKQKCIHLLAFISKEAQRAGDLSKNELPLLCLPDLKEEVDFSEKPSFISSKHGWFMVSAIGGTIKKVTSSLSQGLPLVTKDHPNGYKQARPTYFSDIVAVQIYRIAFLLLTFLCIQAKSATERAEEVGYIDLACFPDLPMPEIFHGLQDQAMAIIVDLCGGKSLTLTGETERVCLLMLQILEKSLYLEFCVTQSCGLRPVLGRVEDVAKEMKSLVQVVKQHKNFSASLTSIRQIVTLVYPGLLQTSSLV
ncbi:hypothetical protein KSP40_PGU001244 [Platanthera guangdongensis]|uniref:Uncharacterized protein n=1 Tax=Platanthera guangdongensis TaxID=2320717 RepID=A0ABR2MVK0_9ASPA